jgi:hypothetical protein
LMFIVRLSSVFLLLQVLLCFIIIIVINEKLGNEAAWSCILN